MLVRAVTVLSNRHAREWTGVAGVWRDRVRRRVV